METGPDKWWRHIPERPWPVWLYFSDLILVAVIAYLWTTYEGVLGFMYGLLVLFLGAIVFFAWMWIRWRTGPRPEAPTKTK
jgi:hypothetical protein